MFLSFTHCVIFSLFTAHVAFSQQIWDTYTTTWDRSRLFEYKKISPPIEFARSAKSAQATISVTDSSTFQTINGFGATLTDTAAAMLSELKTANSDNYWKLMTQLFNTDESVHSAGLSYIRVSLGSSDLSAERYSFNDVKDDSAMKHFNIDKASKTIQILKDIASINKRVQLHLVPWSPPAWMKTNNFIGGGSISQQHYTAFATYLYRAVDEFKSAVGVQPYAISIQNEPQNVDGSYPTCKVTVDAMGSIATQLRAMLNKNGLQSTKVIGFEHNWDDAASYPTQLISKYGKALDGVAFHCYGGDYKQQAHFTSQHPDKEVYFTECTGMIGTNFWSDIKWNMDNILIGSIEYGARTALLWNLAADKKGGPTFPGTDSCKPGGCRPVVTISGGSYTLNQEYYALAQAQRATVPKDADGPSGKRMKVSVSGGNQWALRVGGYVTGRSKDSDFDRYSLVVVNWNDGSKKSIKTNIEFRGMTATYDFPVGVTTLYWYASPNGHARRFENGTLDDTVHVSHKGTALPSTTFTESHESSADVERDDQALKSAVHAHARRRLNRNRLGRGH
jgi:O-glycosyl hydrolase